MTPRESPLTLILVRTKQLRQRGPASFGRLEAIAGATHGLKVTRILGIGFDFFPNAANVDIDGSRGHVGGIAPDGIEKVIAAEDAALVTGEIIEQAELGSGGRDHTATNGKRHGGGIDLDVTDFHRARRERALEAAQHSLNPGDKLARAERLGDVIVGAEFKSKDAIGFTAFGGKKDDRNRGQTGHLADGAADFEAVFAGNHNVQNEQRRTLPLGVGENVDTGRIDAHDEAFILEMVADEAGNIRIVFDNEDARFHNNIVTKAVLST